MSLDLTPPEFANAPERLIRYLHEQFSALSTRAWQDLELVNGWSIYSGLTPQIAKTGTGLVICRGVVDGNTAGGGGGVFANLPSEFAPNDDYSPLFLPCSQYNTNTITINIRVTTTFLRSGVFPLTGEIDLSALAYYSGE